MKNNFLVCVPFTGLGLYNGFRGNRWLRNRISIFEQFVVPSLINQNDPDFTVWVAWRREEKDNKYVKGLYQRLQATGLKVVFTYSGVPFWDDKYSDEEARERLWNTLRIALPELLDAVPDCEHVYWLLQPSDDCYDRRTVQSVKKAFEVEGVQAVSYKRGYICNYNTKQVLEYNPKTNPPFFAIKFPRDVFFDAGRHMNYTGPYKSHEYIGDKLKLEHFEERGFLVGTHQDNISTVFDHPYAGEAVSPLVFNDFGLAAVPVLRVPYSFRKQLFHKMPYAVKRKLRYWSGEKKWIFRPVWSFIYNFLRG